MAGISTSASSSTARRCGLLLKSIAAFVAGRGTCWLLTAGEDGARSLSKVDSWTEVLVVGLFRLVFGSVTSDLTEAVDLDSIIEFEGEGDMGGRNNPGCTPKSLGGDPLPLPAPGPSTWKAPGIVNRGSKAIPLPLIMWRG